MQIKLRYSATDESVPEVISCEVQDHFAIAAACQGYLHHRGGGIVTAFIQASAWDQSASPGWTAWGTYTSTLHDTDRVFTDGELAANCDLPLEVV
jgi:hypothetical protein